MKRLRNGKVWVKVLLRAKLKDLLRKCYKGATIVLRDEALQRGEALKQAGSCELEASWKALQQAEALKRAGRAA